MRQLSPGPRRAQAVDDGRAATLPVRNRWNAGPLADLCPRGGAHMTALLEEVTLRLRRLSSRGVNRGIVREQRNNRVQRPLKPRGTQLSDPRLEARSLGPASAKHGGGLFFRWWGPLAQGGLGDRLHQARRGTRPRDERTCEPARDAGGIAAGIVKGTRPYVAITSPITLEEDVQNRDRKH